MTPYIVNRNHLIQISSNPFGEPKLPQIGLCVEGSTSQNSYKEWFGQKEYPACRFALPSVWGGPGIIFPSSIWLQLLLQCLAEMLCMVWFSASIACRLLHTVLAAWWLCVGGKDQEGMDGCIVSNEVVFNDVQCCPQKVLDQIMFR